LLTYATDILISAVCQKAHDCGGNKNHPALTTPGGGGLPGTVPPVALDRRTTTLMRLDPDGHRRTTLRFASTRHSFTSFRHLSKGGSR